MTPPPTQVEDVELINRVECRRQVQFKEAEVLAKKIKTNWGRKKAKKLHIECNQAAALANKERKAKDKALKRIQKRVASRQERRQQREIEGSAVMDSGTTSTVKYHQTRSSL